MSLRGKKHLKFTFLGYLSKATEECVKKNWSFSDKFGMPLAGSDKYFLEMTAHNSSKVAAKL